MQKVKKLRKMRKMEERKEIEIEKERLGSVKRTICFKEKEIVKETIKIIINNIFKNFFITLILFFTSAT